MAEAHFVIDGDEYPIPGLETLDMDEATVVFNCSGLTLEDFAIDEADPEQVRELEQKSKNPGFLKALMIIAYMRGNPMVTLKKASALIGSSNLFEALQTTSLGQEEDPTEPQKSEPSTPSSPESSDSNGNSSGTDSTKSSDLADKTPKATGTSA